MEIKPSHNQLSDSEFIEQFVNGTLNPKLFNHEAHLRLAWLYIGKYGVERAERDIQRQLLNFDKIVGKGDKYHITVTVVAIKIVNHFMLKSKSSDFTEFIIEFPKLKSEFKELVNAHYSFNIFTSEKAQTEYLNPDLLSFE